MARKVIRVRRSLSEDGFKNFIVFSFIISVIAVLCIAYAPVVSEAEPSSEPVGQTSGGIEQSTGLLTEQMLSIITIIQQNNFDEAGVLTQELLADFPGHPGLPEALYEIAASECEWRPEMAEEAKNIYQQIIHNYPDSLYASKAELGILRAGVLSAITSHDYDRAEEALAQLTADFSSHPYFPETLYRVARAYDRQLEMEYATSTYQQITQNYPDSVYASEANLGIARAEVMNLILLNEHIPSKEALARLIADFSWHPNFPETLYWLAERYRWAREYNEAKSTYKRIMQDYPDSTWAGKAKLGLSRAEALSLINSGNYNQLAEAVDKLIIDFNDHPDLAETLYWIAQECEWMIKLESANNIYQKVIDSCSDGYWADKARLGRTRVNIGDVIEQRDANDAEPAVEELLVDFNAVVGHPVDDNSDMAETLYWLAQRYQDVNSFEKTEDIYYEILQKWPDSKYADKVRIAIPAVDIFALIRSGRHGEALDALDMLIADFKGHPDLAKMIFTIGTIEYYNKALEYEQQDLADRNFTLNRTKDNFARAAAVWDKIVTQLPESKPIVVRHAYYFVANCRRKTGEYEKAIQYWQQLINDCPDFVYACSAQCLIGECYEKWRYSNNIPEPEVNPLIEQTYKAVIEKYPDCSLAGHSCLKLAEPLLQKGRWAEAAMYYELFLEKLPDDPRRADVLYDLAKTYEKMGEAGSAAQVYSAFIETAGPNDRRIEPVKAKIDELKGQVK